VLFFLESSLHVLIDLTQVPAGRMGIGSYAENLLAQFHTVAPEIRFTAILQSDDAPLRAAIPSRFRILQVPARLCRLLPFRLAVEQFLLPFLAWRYRADVIHSLHYSLPQFSGGAKRVVTMHDMTAYVLPHMHTQLKGAYMRFFIRRAIRQADHLIFISQSARDECRRWFGQPLPNATVIHHGKSDAFRPDGPVQELADVRARYGLPEQYLLYLGTLEPRKNVPLLLRAFAELAHRHPEARLVIAGKKGWYFDEIFHTAEALNLQDRVLFTGYIDEPDKPALIRGALLFIYPSLHEGFGIPVLEAMASGVATIAGDRTSIPEIAGDGALLINPESLAELIDALELLYSNPDARARLATKGLEQATKFAWEKTAEETAAVYRLVAGQQRARERSA
jgi:glycosyltransferase involved in cell wall biosynthesis